MCHSSKHTAGICIQDNQTCHVNFILCLLSLFVLSLFLALSPIFFSPPPLVAEMKAPLMAMMLLHGHADILHCFQNHDFMN